ncbi:DegV family protein [Lacticaseibacillus jixianensis]|uniref:DegV family protein n=1 Tax=Lacticaseibacillus jixianensis TaxID=2486012 RepID=A0ABW4BB79_9LACO|nr:DegV family protein [Lacticaseibacillus jixianensis]
MPKKIAILVDSGSDVPQSVLEAHNNIVVVPLNITMNGHNYRDAVDITPDEFYSALTQAKSMPQTASPSPQAAKDAMNALFAAGYQQILGITISSGLSITNRTFQLAAQDFAADQVTILDTKSIGIGSGIQVAYAASLIRSGEPFQQVIEKVTVSIAKSRVYFYVPTLKYLSAGGRIGKVANLVGSVFNIKPVISCDSKGIYYPIFKARSEEKALQKLVDQVIKDCRDSTHFRLGVAHGQNPSLVNELAVKLGTATGRKVDFIGEISPSLGVHTGPGLIGATILSY